LKPRVKVTVEIEPEAGYALKRLALERFGGNISLTIREAVKQMLRRYGYVKKGRYWTKVDE